MSTPDETMTDSPETMLEQALDALAELVGEHDARSDEAAREPGCGGYRDTGGVLMARDVLRRAGRDDQ